jgi:hypothetical protein
MPRLRLRGAVRRVTALAVAAPLIAACHRAPPVRALADPRDEALPSFTIDRALAHRSLYDAVARRWPAMLRADPTVRLSQRDLIDGVVGVYLRRRGDHEAVFVGGVDALYEIPTDIVARVARLSPVREQMRFGLMHAGGACIVTLRD